MIGKDLDGNIDEVCLLTKVSRQLNLVKMNS
jgi:hypothetical protein